MCDPETAVNGEYSRAKQALWIAMQLPEDQAEAFAILELAKEIVPVAYQLRAPSIAPAPVDQ
jgi:hypothetical protein